MLRAVLAGIAWRHQSQLGISWMVCSALTHSALAASSLPPASRCGPSTQPTLPPQQQPSSRRWGGSSCGGLRRGRKSTAWQHNTSTTVCTCLSVVHAFGISKCAPPSAAMRVEPTPTCCGAAPEITTPSLRHILNQNQPRNSAFQAVGVRQLLKAGVAPPAMRQRLHGPSPGPRDASLHLITYSTAGVMQARV